MLADSDPGGRFHYLIQVYTGYRRRAATTAKVSGTRVACVSPESSTVSDAPGLGGSTGCPSNSPGLSESILPNSRFYRAAHSLGCQGLPLSLHLYSSGLTQSQLNQSCISIPRWSSPCMAPRDGVSPTTWRIPTSRRLNEGPWTSSCSPPGGL